MLKLKEAKYRFHLAKTEYTLFTHSNGRIAVYIADTINFLPDMPIKDDGETLIREIKNRAMSKTLFYVGFKCNGDVIAIRMLPNGNAETAYPKLIYEKA